MNVSKWGPDGWKMLHYMTKTYDNKNKDIYFEFFDHIKNILPCIYCRLSYTEYFSKLVFDDNNPMKWLYNIHNMVNNKLRKQKILKTKNPTYSTSKKFINSLKLEDCSGDIFLSCVCFNFPCNYKNNDIKNLKNIYKRFFNLLEKIHPSLQFRKNLKKYKISKDDMYNRQTLFKWYHKVSINKISFKKRYNIIKSYQAKCSNNTCRVKKS